VIYTLLISDRVVGNEPTVGLIAFHVRIYRLPSWWSGLD